MGYGGTILLVVILVIMVALLLLGIRGISWAQNAKKELEEDEEQRLVLKSIGDGQRSIAAALISIQSELADIRNRLASIESVEGQQMTAPSDDDRKQLGRMRIASILEASTLAILVFIAVPLKHVFGMPQVVSVMGPVHGLAFLIYIWMLIQSHFQFGWSGREWVRMVLCAFIPLAGFVNERLLKHRQDALATA